MHAAALHWLVTDSLVDFATDLAAAFEAANPGAKVTITGGSDAALLTQLAAGAACDVVALGDSSSMSRAAAAGQLAVGPGHALELSRSRLALAVTTGNPKQLADLGGLQAPGVRYALGKRTSSVGRYGRWVLSRTGKPASPSAEADTGAGLVDLVRSGKVDAAIIFASSTPGRADGVTLVDLPEADNYPVLYSIAVTRLSREAAAAVALQGMALGTVGKALLRRHGLLPPP